MFLTMALSLSLLGQEKLTGSDKGLGQAAQKSRIIVVAELEDFVFICGNGPIATMAGAKFKVTKVIKGVVKDGEMTGLSMSAIGAERLPKKGEECVYFLNDLANHLNAVKVLAKSEEILETVRRSTEAE